MESTAPVEAFDSLQLHYPGIYMAVSESTYRAEVLEELEKIPVEYRPSLVKLMQAFREGVAPREAAETFSQGWQEALAEQTRPLSELWEGVDAE